jgi:AbrB family looped-hinge helix DNA binding protein
MELAKITLRGQITIPAAIRKKLGVKDGDKVIFIVRPCRPWLFETGIVVKKPYLLKRQVTERKPYRIFKGK